MSTLIKPWERARSRVVNDPHLWVVILLVVALAVFYYQDVILDERFVWFWQLEVFEFNNRIHGILFCLPVVYAAFIFWWRGVLITWLFSVAIILPRILFFHSNISNIVINLLFLMIPILAVFYISIELNWRKKERRVAEERELERQDYMSRIFKAQEDERQRLARELHDETLQTMLVIATRAEALSSFENVKNEPRSREQVEWIKNTSLSVSDELRRISLDLRPSILDNLGLIPALRWLVTILSQDGIDGRLEVIGETRILLPEIDINIFRIVQEALNNIRRHSKASAATVFLEFKPESMFLKIQDNGIGFFSQQTTDKLTASGKLGLTGIQQRVKFLNGTFSLDSGYEKGTTITIEIRA